jgi:hypothetical protein
MRINGHEISLTLLLSAVVAAGGLLTWVGSLSADNADVKRRLQVVEERQKEDRRETKNAVKEIQADMRETKDAVYKILVKIEGISKERGERGR